MFSFSTTEVAAQQFSREAGQFLSENAREFLKPLADGLISGMHSGFAAAPNEPGFHVGAHFVVIGAIVPDDRKVFRPRPFSKTVEFSYNGLPFLGDLDLSPPELPTAVGLGKRYTFTGRLKRIRPKGSPYIGQFDFIQQDATVTVGGYQDFSVVPLFAPQVNVGTVYGTGLTLRFLPSVGISDLGRVSVFGFGIRHNVGRYFRLPVGLAAQITYETTNVRAADREFNLDLDLSGFSAQVFVNKKFFFDLLAVMPFAGVGFESGSIGVRYAFADPYIGTQILSFTQGGAYRFLAGISIMVSLVTLNADVNVASMNGFSARVGIDI